jgi:hypothetical protein
MGNAGSKIANYFKQDWHSAEDAVGGIFSGISATVQGLTGGGFNYGKAGAYWHNYGQDVKNALTGTTGGTDSTTGVSYAQQAKNKADAQQAQRAQEQQRQVQWSYDPNNPANQSMWRSSTNVAYGAQGPLSGVTPPSHINAISDPATKQSIAGSRGALRSTLNMAQNAQNVAMSQPLATATMPSQSSQAGTGTAPPTSQSATDTTQMDSS